MKKIQKKIGFLGCGNMGTAILDGIVSKKLCTHRSIAVYDSDPKKARMIKKVYGITSVMSEDELIAKSDIIVLAVKPQTLSKLSRSVTKKKLKNKVIVSILAGTPSRKIKKAFATKNVIRIMPNLGAMFGVGISAIAPSKTVTKSTFITVVRLFSACGEVVILSERHMDAVTAISGSGPAYYFYLSELLIDAAIRNGIPKKAAYTLVTKTAHAASLMMDKSALSPKELRKMVASKGGTTEAALAMFTLMNLGTTIGRGVKAAITRSKQISR
ncbi:pyrroline-5-carboxylate reductase [Candidatus Omnitrophota bacterium]